MKGTVAWAAGLALVVGVSCSKNDLASYSLGSETYQNFPDCKQLYFKGKPVPGVFLKKLNKANGARLEGVACHDKTFVINAETGFMQEGAL